MWNGTNDACRWKAIIVRMTWNGAHNRHSEIRALSHPSSPLMAGSQSVLNYPPPPPITCVSQETLQGPARPCAVSGSPPQHQPVLESLASPGPTFHNPRLLCSLSDTACQAPPCAGHWDFTGAVSPSCDWYPRADALTTMSLLSHYLSGGSPFW